VNATPLPARQRQRRRGVSLAALLYVLLLGAFAYALCLDGYLRLTTGNNSLRIVRDVCPGSIVIVLVAALSSRRLHFPRLRLAGWVGLFVLIVAAQIVNPAVVSRSAAIFAMAPHLEFVPLFLAAALVLGRDDRLKGLFVLLVVAGAANGVAGGIQSALSTADFSNLGPGYKALVDGSTVGARFFVSAPGVVVIRPPGLGSDSGFAAVVGMMAVPAALALVLTCTGWRRMTSLAAIPLIILGIATAQTRAGLVAAIFALVVFLVLIGARRGAGRTLVTVCAVGAAIAFVSGHLLTGVSTSRYSTVTPDKLTSTFGEDRGTSWNYFAPYVVRFPFGAGIGTVGPGSSVNASQNRHSGLNSEVGGSFLVLETGIPGLLAMVALYIGTLALGIKLTRHRHGGSGASVLMAALVAGVAGSMLLFVSGPVMTGPPFTLFFYTAAGCFAGRAAAARSVARRAAIVGRSPVESPKPARGFAGSPTHGAAGIR
jgi:hypothetical protein